MQLIDIKTVLGMEIQPKSILAGEAHALWNFLHLRYLYYELTGLFQNYISSTKITLSSLCSA